MNLYIEIDNGKPINNPLSEDNLLSFYGGVDANRFIPFIRKDFPESIELPRTELQVVESSYVQAEDGLSYTDEYYVRDMTSDEITRVTAERNEGIKTSIESFISSATEQLNSATTDDKPVWEEYINSLINFTYTDPFTVRLPTHPTRSINGNIVSLSTISGSSPNVIE